MFSGFIKRVRDLEPDPVAQKIGFFPQIPHKMYRSFLRLFRCGDEGNFISGKKTKHRKKQKHNKYTAPEGHDCTLPFPSAQRISLLPLSYQRISMAPQVRPPPKAVMRTRSPRSIFPARLSSSRQIPMEAAEVFPYFSMLT